MQLRAASMALIQWTLLSVFLLLGLATRSSAQTTMFDGSGMGSGLDSTDSPFTSPPDQEGGDGEDDAFPFDHEKVDICVASPIGMELLVVVY